MAASTAEEPRTRLLMWRESVARLEEEQADLEAYIAASPAREQELRTEFLLKSPTQTPDATSPVGKERRKREEAEKKLETVRLNLASLRELLERAEAEERARIAQEHAREADRLREVEANAWRRLGEIAELFIRTWATELRPAAEELDAWRESAAVEATSSADAAEYWRQSTGRHLVVPFPADPLECFRRLCLTALDPQRNGVRENPDAKLDDNHVLPELVADLRDLPMTLGFVREQAARSADFQHRWTPAGADFKRDFG